MDKENLLEASYAGLLDEERRILSRVHAIASELDRYSPLAEQARDLLDHLDELFLLVVVGEVKSGKSSFINGLVGKVICPEGPIPVTDKVNILHYDSKEKERVIEDFIIERSYPLDILRNLSIVDTPGTNSIIRRHQEITEKFIPKADLILFVTCIDRPFTETEYKFLSFIAHQWRKKIVVILSKVDTRTEEEITIVKDYIAENAKAKLEIEPLIFPVSPKNFLIARQTDDTVLAESSGMLDVEKYIRETLSDAEKMKLKLASPVESALSVIEALEARIDERRGILDKDFDTLNNLDAQISQTCKELEERCFKCITEIYDLLRQFERRGLNFLEDKIRLSSINTIRDSEKFKAIFEKEVVSDLKTSIDDSMHTGVDWLMRENISLYEKSIKFLKDRVDTDRYKDKILGGDETSFDYNRERIFGAMQDGFKKQVTEFDFKGECNRVVDLAYKGLLSFIGVEIGAVGISVIAIMSNAFWFDVTGFLFAGLLALTGFLILPAKKRKAIKQFRLKVDDLITEFRKVLTSEFDREITNVQENIRSSYKPYMTFYKAETSKIEGYTGEITELHNGLTAIRTQIETLSSADREG